MAHTPRQAPPDLVIFDCDGVLVDSEGVANAMLARAVTQLGWPTTAAQSHARFRGRSMASAVTLIEAELGCPVPDGWGIKTQDAITQAVVAEVTAIPGAAALVAKVAAAGVHRCVASSSTPAYLRQVLARTQLDRHFGAAVYSATMVAAGKPAPDLFMFAAARMRRLPAGAVVIEDTVPGVMAGVAAGMQVIGYAGDPYTDADALARAGATVVRDMAQVPALLGL